jgi:hypothetical protein
MRRVLKLSLISTLAAAFSIGMAPVSADAQQQRPGQTADQRSEEGAQTSRPRFAPLRRNTAAGPCPYVKILYDAARYVEMPENQLAAANAGFTGEIEGLSSVCRYQSNEPITVDMRVLFSLGRGPQAQTDGRTYRYWVAVTERNKAVLAKTYFDLPVAFDGSDRTTVTQEQTIVIPRADATTSGDNFEILVGFDVTPAMVELNRTGSRFRINAGAPSAAQPPAE